MAQRSESELRKQLVAEGFAHTFVWQDGPQAFYPDHTHAGVTAHIILDGEMTLTMDGVSQTFRVGDRCDVPAGAVHSARMGPRGCRYLVGESGDYFPIACLAGIEPRSLKPYAWWCILLSQSLALFARGRW